MFALYININGTLSVENSFFAHVATLIFPRAITFRKPSERAWYLWISAAYAYIYVPRKLLRNYYITAIALFSWSVISLTKVSEGEREWARASEDCVTAPSDGSVLYRDHSQYNQYKSIRVDIYINVNILFKKSQQIDINFIWKLWLMRFW